MNQIMKQKIQIIAGLLLVALAADPTLSAVTKPVRVFILIGQSNRETLNLTKTALANIQKLVPDSDGSYVLSGIGWHQGWNDRINDKFNAEYESNLVHFIHDIRKDLGAPALPFVIAETGMQGPEENHPRTLSLMKAQAAVAEHPEFKGNVAFVSTREFWRPQEQSPSGQGYHWNSNAETHYLIGEAMGKATAKLVTAGDIHQVQEAEMAGYLLVPNDKAPETFDARLFHVCSRLAFITTIPGKSFSNRPVRDLDARRV